jgi:hypothetical protein
VEPNQVFSSEFCVSVRHFFCPYSERKPITQESSGGRREGQRLSYVFGLTLEERILVSMT